MSHASAVLFRAAGITKRYAVTVLDDVSLELRGGELHALLGANGAGKSTLCKIISGLVPATAGQMSLEGRRFAPSNKQAAEAAGVQIVQQELNLIATLTVAENMMLGRIPHLAGVIRQRQLKDRARAALDRFDLHDIAVDQIVGSLGVGRQQMIEIATALDRECRLLILDEPTAALSAGETEVLFRWLEKLRQQGVGLLYISHRLDEVARIADCVTVLRDGRHVCTRPAAELTTDAMVDLMSGEESVANQEHVYASHVSDRVALRVDRMSSGTMVRDVSFQVHCGERLGIAGLVGAGRTELLRAVFGADRADSGWVYASPTDVRRRFASPRAAVAAGLAMVTEDRKQNGLLLPLSVRVNMAMCSLWPRFSTTGLLRDSEERRSVQEMNDTMEVRGTGIEQSVGTLSGGNQQKVAIAKWLIRDADVYLFDEPTRGIDVAARRRIYRLFEALSQAGKALVIVSSDIDELTATCDRISVMSAGRLVQTFAREEWSQEKIMKAAFAGHVSPVADRNDL